MKNHISKRLLLFSFFAVFVFKVAEVEYLTHLEYKIYPYTAGGRWANIGGDSFSYIGAMENYISKGSYYFLNDKEDTVRAGRLPHYSIPYYVLRQFLPMAAALDGFILFQIAIEAVAAVCLALLACAITGNYRSYFVSLILSIISLYITVWSYNTFTDAVSTNLLLIAAYFYYRYQNSRSNRHFIIFSFFFAWVVCLRPYLVLLYLVVGFVELFNSRLSVPYLLKKFGLTVLPLVLLLTPWVIRNYQLLGRFVLFQQDMYAGYAITDQELTVRKTLTALGEEGSTWWDNKAAASYFSKRSKGASVYDYPSYIKNDPGTFATFEVFRKVSLDSTINNEEVKKAATVIIAFYRYKYPARYYVLNPVKPVLRFVINNGSYRLPVDIRKPVELMVKLTQSLLYYCYLVFGSIGLILMVFRNKRYMLFLLPTVYLILLFPVFLGLTEWRYFLPFYLFHQLGIIYILYYLYNKKSVSSQLPVGRRNFLKTPFYTRL